MSKSLFYLEIGKLLNNIFLKRVLASNKYAITDNEKT